MQLNLALFPAQLNAGKANDVEKGGWETALSENPSDPCLTHWYYISCNEGSDPRPLLLSLPPNDI